MSKQDRQGVRTPADVERKYKLGGNIEEIRRIAEKALSLSGQGAPGADGVGIESIEVREGVSETETVLSIKLTNGSVTSVYIPNGEDGLTPFIGDNGNWWIGETDTGIKAAGKDGAVGADGKDGASISVTSVTESSADGGSNVVTFSDGKTLTIKNGSKGSSGFFTLSVDSEGNLYAHTADDENPPEFEYDEESGDLYIVMGEN